MPLPEVPVTLNGCPMPPFMCLDKTRLDRAKDKGEAPKIKVRVKKPGPLGSTYHLQTEKEREEGDETI